MSQRANKGDGTSSNLLKIFDRQTSVEIKDSPTGQKKSEVQNQHTSKPALIFSQRNIKFYPDWRRALG